jgi:hypothetical protein
MNGLTDAMRNTVLGSAMALALMAAPRPLRAEDQPSAGSPLKAGDRIRIWAADLSEKTVGRVVEAGPDFLRLQVKGRTGPVAVPLAAVTRLERSLGRRSSAGKGALIGTVVGTGLGAALVMASLRSDSDCDGPCTPYAIIAASAIVGAGALVGAFSGAVIKTERWESVGVGRVGVNVIPVRRGAGVAVSVRF